MLQPSGVQGRLGTTQNTQTSHTGGAQVVYFVVAMSSCVGIIVFIPFGISVKNHKCAHCRRDGAVGQMPPAVRAISYVQVRACGCAGGSVGQQPLAPVRHATYDMRRTTYVNRIWRSAISRTFYCICGCRHEESSTSLDGRQAYNPYPRA